MKQTYLIDSENVNDLWVNLLDNTAADAELLVFYTKNSPHMGYSNVRKLKESERTVTFIKCYEGTNALDFQLVSELGYRLKSCEDQEMIVVTNDNGFDAAVNYWKDRGYQVRRMNGQACSGLKFKLVPQTEVDFAPEASQVPEELSQEAKLKDENSKKKQSAENEEQVQSETENVTNSIPREELDTIVRCLGKKKIAELHNAFVAIYGDLGKDYYAIVKQKSYKVEPQAWKLTEKIDHYVAVVFANSELGTAPDGFGDFLFKSRDKMKNLNSFRAALTKQYGKENGGLYYTLIKNHVKWLLVMN